MNEEVEDKEITRPSKSLESETRPRLKHASPDGTPLFTNELIHETSPYLLQHAHNPVKWHAWGTRAFDAAKTTHKPILLSVGYSTCHWCHVMEQESFEDLEIAQTMNAHFVCIKVDREERPDVDGVYMAALQMLSGRGGWPMTVIMTPDRVPIFAGTYFPPRDGDRGASVGFLTILQKLAKAWSDDPQKITNHAVLLQSRIQSALQTKKSDFCPGPEPIQSAVHHLAVTFDPVWGGFGDAPKFPRSHTLELLARNYQKTKDERILHMMVHTLEKMSQGGIRDHVAGGFHRYSVDEQWLVPHFEKMLYDNAQLAIAFLEAYQITRRSDFAHMATDTLDYLKKDMQSPNGGFYSATDADSPSPTGDLEEGWYFTWTPKEIHSVLGKEAAERMIAHFGVTEEGNFEGRNILHTRHGSDNTDIDVAGISDKENARFIQDCKNTLLKARKKRPKPLPDDKILCSWNALAVSAFARAGFVLENQEYVKTAERTAAFLLNELVVDGTLRRSWKSGVVGPPGFLDDFAFLIQALLDIHETTGTGRWLQAAVDLQKDLDAQFFDENNGGYFFTPNNHEALLFRDKPFYDAAEPSGNSVATLNLLRLEQFTGDLCYRTRAESIFEAAGEFLTQGIATPKMLCALDYYLDEPKQIVVVMGPDENQNQAMLAPIRKTFVPNKALLILGYEKVVSNQPESAAFAKDKSLVENAATAYVCQGQTCHAPTHSPEELEKMLELISPQCQGHGSGLVL